MKIYVAKGNYKGKLESRAYVFQIHSLQAPKQVMLQNIKLKNCKTKENFAKAKTGWYLNSEDKKGVIYIKTDNISTSKDVLTILKY